MPARLKKLYIRTALSPSVAPKSAIPPQKLAELERRTEAWNARPIKPQKLKD
jgi:hypothetical protein